MAHPFPRDITPRMTASRLARRERALLWQHRHALNVTVLVTRYTSAVPYNWPIYTDHVWIGLGYRWAVHLPSRTHESGVWELDLL